MQGQIYKLTFFLLLTFIRSSLIAQSVPEPKDISEYNGFSLVYDIQVHSTKEPHGFEETYNGSTKTIMHQNGNTRIRLVSLMRIQNIYLYEESAVLKKVILTKESGKNQYKYVLTPSDWKIYNTRYDNIKYTYLHDSINILGFECKKAVLSINNGKQQITAYYTKLIKPLSKSIEPMFAGLPGLVLRYEMETKNGSIRYVANKINIDKLESTIFTEPEKGFTVKKYKPYTR